LTIQQVIEEQLSKILREELNIMGCGRTDAGVHASSFYFHADLPSLDPKLDLCYKLNRMLGDTILIYEMIQVNNEAHARFDATKRSYTYYLSTQKQLFRHAFNYSLNPISIEKLNAVTSLLLGYKEFFPFCKSNTDVNNYICHLESSKWIQTSETCFEFQISANRFLRGMVRLIVGACLTYMEGRITLEEIENCLKNQTRLSRDNSVPADGLFLTQVDYPYIKEKNI